MASVPDVMVAAKGPYQLHLENDRVRVMEVRLRPGQKAPMHNHPYGHVMYLKSDCKVKFTSPDGKDTAIELKAGQTLWLEAGSHEAQNVGNTEFDSLVVEVKK